MLKSLKESAALTITYVALSPEFAIEVVKMIRTLSNHVVQRIINFPELAHING